MKIGTMLLAVVCALGGAHAAEFTLKAVPSTLADWKDASFYEGEDGAPSGASTDLINVPDKMEVEVSADDVLAFLGGISGIRLVNSTNCIFAIRVDSGTKEFAGKVQCAKNNEQGRYVKRGNGELKLTAKNAQLANALVCVEAGSLRMAANPGLTVLMTGLEICQGATFHPASGNWTQVRELFGAGTFDNDTGITVTFSLTASGVKKRAFTGLFKGPVNIPTYGASYLALTNPENSFYGNVSLNEGSGVIGVKSFGKKTDTTSSIGLLGSSDSYLLTAKETGEPRVLYLGTGERTDKDIWLYNCLVLDGGEGGGLDFAGRLRGDFNNKTVRTLKTLILDGANMTNECTFSAGLPDSPTADGINQSFKIVKRGTGTWMMPDRTTGNLSGLVAVENGTLAFATIAETNKMCSLGTATTPTTATGCLWSDSLLLPYAFLLGGGADEKGLLEYRGTESRQVLTRHFALKGVGGVSVAKNAGRMAFAGAGVAEGFDSGTLVLGGEGQQTNLFFDVTNGYGVASVRKEGGGIWKLTGNLEFTGSIDVRGGELQINKPAADAKPDWYRMTFRENAFNNSRWGTDQSNWAVYMFCLNELGIYNAEGERVNLGLVQKCRHTPEFVAGNGYYTNLASWVLLEPGEASYGVNKRYQINPTTYDHDLFGMFDGNVNTAWGYGDAAAVRPKIGNDASACPIVMHLPVGAVAASYDMKFNYATTQAAYGRNPTAYVLEGSYDGYHWQPIDQNDDVDLPLAAYAWMSNGSTSDKQAHGVAMDFSQVKLPSVLENGLASVSVSGGGSLKVVGGGTVEVACLKLDGEANGSLDGITLASEGVLEVANFPAGREITIPVKFANAGDSLPNLSSWTLKINGKVTATKNVSATPDGIKILSKGLLLIVQ